MLKFFNNRYFRKFTILLILIISISFLAIGCNNDSTSSYTTKNLEESDNNKIDIDGSGTKEDPFIIYSFKELELLSQAKLPLDAHYQLANDIDANKTRNDDYNDSKGWKPIGDKNRSFRGVFDGNGYKINNLYINSSDNYIGFFGKVNEGEIKNVGLVDINVKVDEWSNYTGGLVGYNIESITDSYTEVHVKGNKNIGGLVGRNQKEIVNSYAIGDVKGDNSIGGLVGSHHYGIIKNSYATGNIFGGGMAGGLVGFNVSEIKESYAEGDVKGDSSIGGVVGFNNGGIIKRIYAVGDISGSESVGGIIGANSDGILEESYATGNVKGDENAGGLIGYNFVGSNFDGKAINSYWNTETSGQNDSDGGEGKTTSEMQQKTTYNNWDFDNIWTINEGDGYPRLQWE